MYIESFPSKLKKAREKTGLTQREVSSETGIPQSTLAGYETGRTQPDIENLGILLDFYNESADWVIGIKNNNKSPQEEKGTCSKTKQQKKN